MAGQSLRAAFGPGGPEAKAAHRQALLTKPKALPVVTKNPDHGGSPVPKDEDRALERFTREFVPADTRKTVNPLAEVRGLQSDEDFHVRRELDHMRSSRKSRVRVESSVSNAPFNWMRIFAPHIFSNST